MAAAVAGRAFPSLGPPSLALVALLLLVVVAPPPASSDDPARKKKINRCPLRPSSDVDRPPLILGHRGASFHLPEHTLASYRLALELGADYIEPDLVPCKTGELVAVHSVDLNITTNVHTYNDGEFRNRARKSEANNDEWGYYVHDFTWEEVQKLSVKQRVSDSGARYDGYDWKFGIPSFSQIVHLLHDWNTRELPLIGRPSKVGGVPGLYVELKRSRFLQEDADISIADLLIEELATHPGQIVLPPSLPPTPTVVAVVVGEVRATPRWILWWGAISRRILG